MASTGHLQALSLLFTNHKQADDLVAVKVQPLDAVFDIVTQNLPKRRGLSLVVCVVLQAPMQGLLDDVFHRAGGKLDFRCHLVRRFLSEAHRL